MRICLVVHGFPPVERTGVENYSLGLARSLARAGHRVEVFVPRKDPVLADLALRREERDGFSINWITNNRDPLDAREALLVKDLKAPFSAFLERERPEVVHFHHLIKLGIGLVQVVQERGLPTVYTAHDYYPICHRYTLLRPDLSRCDVRGDSRACAHCDLALGHLNAQQGLGDYHAGVLRSQLSAPAWERLSGILAQRAEENGVAAGTVKKAVELRTELDRLRAEAYGRFDLVLSPSRFLIDELARGGFEKGRILHQPLGFDNADLAGLSPLQAIGGRVRFAFLGGLAKHKGVHVLLEAFARLPGGAELSVWGGSSDRAYVELIRARAGEVGAQYRGTYERADLPRILAEVDAVVVPSLWVENYPLVIREAFSAGRPVLASRLGALAESVRDGVDGILFAPGDAQDLARALARCVDEPELLQRLARGIQAPKTVAEETRELCAHYERLVRSKRGAEPKGDLPASLQGTLARFDALAALPARELLVNVLTGLDGLREAWADEVGPLSAVELLAHGLGEGSEVQDRLREARNEIAWLLGGRDELKTLFQDLEGVLEETRTEAEKKGEHLESAGSYVRHKEQEVTDAHARLRELEAVIAQKNQHIGSVEGELREAGRYIRHKEQEYLDVEAELQKAAAHARAKEAELVQAKREREERLAVLDGRTKTVAEISRLSLQAQERLLNRTLRPLLTRLHELFDPEGELELPAEGAPFMELIDNLRRIDSALAYLAKEVTELRPLKSECEWRRERMERIVGTYQKNALLRLALAPTPLAKVLKKWAGRPWERTGGPVP